MLWVLMVRWSDQLNASNSKRWKGRDSLLKYSKKGFNSTGIKECMYLLACGCVGFIICAVCLVTSTAIVFVSRLDYFSPFLYLSGS